MVQRLFLSLVLVRGALAGGDHSPFVTAVDSIGLTVSDLDRSVEFYSKVLSFEKISETEVDGPDYEHLEGVFGLQMLIARMRLGEELAELESSLRPQAGRLPPNSAPRPYTPTTSSHSPRAIRRRRTIRSRPTFSPSLSVRIRTSRSRRAKGPASTRSLR